MLIGKEIKYMAKKECVVCNKSIGMLSSKASISDGYVCSECLKKASISVLANNLQSFSALEVKELINRRIDIVNSFKATKKIAPYLYIDENNKGFKIGNNIFEYSNLLSFELLEDGETITKGGLGRAVAGGLLFGGVGAIVGGVTGGKKSSGVCSSLKLRVTLRNAHIDTVYIDFINTETKTKSFIYKAAQENAQSCISALEIIADQNRSGQSELTSTTTQTVSAADEIAKFKQLADQGIITQEEFEAKKKQLLGL